MRKKMVFSLCSALILCMCLGFIAQATKITTTPPQHEKRLYIPKDRVYLSQKGIYVHLHDCFAPVQVESIACDEVGLYIPKECLGSCCNPFACNRCLGHPLAFSFM